MPTANQKSAAASIPYKTLRSLHQNYLNGKHKLLPGNTAAGDTKSVWFELNDAMRDFLKKALEDPNVDGIRAYILQYPPKQTDMDGEVIPKNEDDVNQLSIGFVSTTQSAGGSVDYAKLSNDKKEGALPEALNHGELCPRNCPVDPPPAS